MIIRSGGAANGARRMPAEPKALAAALALQFCLWASGCKGGAMPKGGTADTTRSGRGNVRAVADVLPPERRTVWEPGIPGGIPRRTAVCAVLDAASLGNGTIDATAAIQAAIDACPQDQVVRLSAGDFLVNGNDPIRIHNSVVLRGAGPTATRLLRTSTVASPLLLIGERWLQEATSLNLSADAPKGARSVQLPSTAGFSIGQLVLLDELTDDSYVYWGTDAAVAPGAPGRGWFTRYDRPVGQMLEIA